MLVYPSIGLSGGLGIPFVPFTFPTVLFVSLAESIGYPSITWGVADKIWSVYSKGVDSGAIKGGFTNESIRYLGSKGIDDLEARRWLAVAEVAAEQWWGQGTYFVTFGASGGVVGAAGGLIQGAAEIVKTAVDGVLGGIGRALGIPRWIMWAALLLGLAVVVWLVVKAYSPRALRFG